MRCYQPWVMCRHENASKSAEGLADAIGKIPATMRQYIRHVIALPPARFESEQDTYNDFDTILLKGEVSLHSVIAEAAIGLGRHTSMTGMNYWGVFLSFTYTVILPTSIQKTRTGFKRTATIPPSSMPLLRLPSKRISPNSQVSHWQIISTLVYGKT